MKIKLKQLIVSISWLKLALELFVVATGVFLGFFLTNLQSTRNEESAKEIVLENIRAEMFSNMHSLVNGFPFRLIQLEAMLTLADSMDGSRIIMDYPEYRGFGFPSLKDAAWQAALLSGILPKLDYQEVLAVGAIYKKQELNEETGKNINNFLSNNIAVYQKEQGPTVLKMLTVNSLDYLRWNFKLYGNYAYYLKLTKYQPLLNDTSIFCKMDTVLSKFDSLFAMYKSQKFKK